MASSRRKPALGGQIFGLVMGLPPLFLVMALLTRGGVSLHRIVLGLWILAILGFLTSVAYHLSYRRAVPKSVISAHSPWKTVPIALLVFVLGLLNMWGASGGWALQLTSNQMENPRRWLQLAAKLALHEPAVGGSPPVGFAPWVLAPDMLGGALWGALGYAAIFAIGAALASSFRKEAFDPRQEPFGTAAFWPILRPLIGYYYGWGLGFGFGLVLIWGLTIASAGLDPIPPAILALRLALGAVPDPNRAFTMALVAGAWLLAAAMVFLGKGDFTVTFTDPKPPEKDPPMRVEIPALPETPKAELDFSALVSETDQLAASFARDLQNLTRQIGLADDPPPAFTPPPAVQATVDEVPEIPTANLLSARRPDFDLSFDQALGQLSNVFVQISARLGQLEVSLADWLTLEEGSLLEMARSSDGSIDLCINGRPVGRAKPAAFENHVAVKVVKLEPGTVEALKGGA